jgi:hypothetical protein
MIFAETVNGGSASALLAVPGGIIMKVVYRVLAYLIAAAVAIQAAAVALAFFGLITWVEDGGTLDMAGMEAGTIHFGGESGFAVHAISGMMVIPILGLLLLICSFFLRSGKAIAWAGIVLGCIVVQVLLGMFAHGMYWLGALHGLFAFALLAAAVIAANVVTRLGRDTASPARAAEPADVAP